MVGWEARKVLDLYIVALAIGVVGTLVRAVARCCTAEDTGVVIRGVVDPDDDALPVVTVAAGDVSGVGLVFWEVPGVHDGKFALVPGGTGVDLAFVAVTAAGANVAGILETSTAAHISRTLCISVLLSAFTSCFLHHRPQCTAGSHGRYGAEE